MWRRQFLRRRHRLLLLFLLLLSLVLLLPLLLMLVPLTAGLAWPSPRGRLFVGVRKAVAANMTRSRSEIPEATVWVDVDATALLEMRAELKKRAPHDTPPGLLASSPVLSRLG